MSLNDVRVAYRLLKIFAAGVAPLVLGVIGIASGTREGVIGGIGALIVSAVMLVAAGLMVIVIRAGDNGTTGSHETDRSYDVEGPEAKARWGLLWTGIAICSLPAPMYFYFRYAMSPFPSGPYTFLCVPLFIAGLGCVAIGIKSTINGCGDEL